MDENKDEQTTSVSEATTLEKVAEYWDVHSLADHRDKTQPVTFEVRVERRHRVTLDPDVYSKVESQARLRSILPETLVNLWLAERLLKQE